MNTIVDDMMKALGILLKDEEIFLNLKLCVKTLDLFKEFSLP